MIIIVDTIITHRATSSEKESSLSLHACGRGCDRLTVSALNSVDCGRTTHGRASRGPSEISLIILFLRRMGRPRGGNNY